MRLRYCLARVRRRGYGLGNEIVPWARAFLAAQVLDARLLPPAFGLNRRAYWRDFATSPDDWLFNRAIEHLLPVVEFTEADYLAHGGGDVVRALRGFAEARGLQRRPAFLFVTEGLWGGYHHVMAAREFVRTTLYSSRYAAANLLRLRQRIDPDRILIGMHVRLGDFRTAASLIDHRQANVALPLEWFLNVAEGLRRRLGEEPQFLLVSDGTEQQLRPLLEALPCVGTGDLPNGDCSDVLALAQTDLLVCSASTYSHLAAFLSDSPYVWFAPNLFEHPEGCYSLGDATRALQRPDSPCSQALRRFAQDGGDPQPRGVPVDLTGRLPDGLIERILQRRSLRRWQSDLVLGGVVPALAGPAAERRAVPQEAIARGGLAE